MPGNGISIFLDAALRFNQSHIDRSVYTGKEALQDGFIVHKDVSRSV